MLHFSVSINFLPSSNEYVKATNSGHVHCNQDCRPVSLKCVLAGADLHSKNLDAPRSNFLHFHAVFGEIWQNNRLAPPSEKSWIRRWLELQHMHGEFQYEVGKHLWTICYGEAMYFCMCLLTLSLRLISEITKRLLLC